MEMSFNDVLEEVRVADDATEFRVMVDNFDCYVGLTKYAILDTLEHFVPPSRKAMMWEMARSRIVADIVYIHCLDNRG